GKLTAAIDEVYAEIESCVAALRRAGGLFEPRLGLRVGGLALVRGGFAVGVLLLALVGLLFGLGVFRLSDRTELAVAVADEEAGLKGDSQLGLANTWNRHKVRGLEL